MRCLALDFDGVLVSSRREVLAVALDAYASLRPASPLHRRPSQSQLTAGADTAAFERLVPLGNRAEDFGVALRAIDAGVEIPDQAAYDAFFAAQDPEWLDRFHRAFYTGRERLRAASLERWLGLHEPYQPFLDLLRRTAGTVHLAVATAKDRDSVALLLSAFGVGDLFPPAAIFDKETGVDKTRHMEAISEHLGLAFGSITFVDDKVNHLQRVAGIGVRPVLASWGYNSPRERAVAVGNGFAVATLDNAEQVLFTAVGRDHDQ